MRHKKKILLAILLGALSGVWGQKSQSEFNSQNYDVYGKWQWNKDKSIVYLPSSNINRPSNQNDPYLFIRNNNGELSWGFVLPQGATGCNGGKNDRRENFAYLTLSFDGSPEQSFAFINDKRVFTYVQQDLSKTLKQDNSLSQFKDKHILVLYYNLLYFDRAAIFQLEGLEAVYNVLTQQTPIGH